ncbi:DUF397 domain-containing protein [Actinomadura fulvescens]|uniref:DUF397 domain-containing protein n=1 Tax=Actinomadura fulvescens TaxID=46160 RepID=A0ABN3R0Y9_9ACTN
MDLRWRKSSYSEGGTSGQCVELAALHNKIGIRDSKALEAGHLEVGRADLAVLVVAVKAGQLDFERW